MAFFWAKANANFFTGPSHKCDGNDKKSSLFIAVGFSQRTIVAIS